MAVRFKRMDTLEDRTRAILGIAIIIFLVILSRLWYLQVIKGPYYLEKAEQNRLAKVYISAPRGEILDRNGAVLATNRTAYSISIVPKDVVDKQATLKLLAQLTGMSLDEMTRKYDEHTKGVFRQPYKPLKLIADADPKVLASVAERRYELTGVLIEEEPYRMYPQGSIAGNVIGYMGQINEDELRELGTSGYRNTSQIGKSGIERQLEGYLHGKDGINRIEVDSAASPVSTLSAVDPVPGSSVVLTVDLKLQSEAERLLGNMIDSLRKSGKSPDLRSGAIVAMDPRNGDVLALASYPDYDPGLFIPSVSASDWKKLSSEPSALFNRAISGAFPPGSTFKAIVAAAALEAGLLDPDEEFLCTQSVAEKYYGMRCMSWEFGYSHGHVNLYEAIATSCNIYFYELGKRLSVDQLSQMSERFGLGMRTGIELALIESAGKVLKSSDRKVMPGEKLSYTIGQMVTVTPLQLARMYSAIANRGTLYEPTIVKGVIGPDGSLTPASKDDVIERIELSDSTWDAIHKGMRMTVTEGTGARHFQGFPIPVSGKTGTAQAPPKDEHAWFVCWAPSDKPEIVVAVLLENGITSSAYIARDMLECYFGLAEYAQADAQGGAPVQ